MQDKVFFKIIIPNYNNMAYIRQCLDSVLNQSFQDFKIILVDDQSTDMSYEFAKMYERKYPDRLIVLQPKEKAYAGKCRNIGIQYDKCECQYYYFMDSDDYLYDNTCLQKLYNNARDLKNDIILFNWARDFQGKICSYKFPPFEKCLETLAGRANNPNNNNCCYWCAAWSKIVKSNHIKLFLEKQCMCGEDTYQWVQIMDNINTYKQINDIIYVYRNNPSGIINSKQKYNESKKIFYSELEKLLKTVQKQNVKISIQNRLKYH